MRLGVNIDHIATVRQARLGTMPDPVEAALICEQAGAESIVCHLREDRRHIQDDDVVRLVQQVRTFVNLEMSIAEDVVELAMRLRPKQVTLVPERRRELTTEGGLDVPALGRRLKRLIGSFHGRGIEVSLFVDPFEEPLATAREAGAKIVELHTGKYAEAHKPADHSKQLGYLRHAAGYARQLGMRVAAGHGLNYDNVGPVAALPHIEELNIGFSIIARSVFVGMKAAVAEMKNLVS